MIRSAVLPAIFLICAETTIFAQKPPGFIFEFATAAPEEFEDASGEMFGPFEVLAAIRPERLEGPEGPEGWSLAVSHDPLLELLQVTIEGTNAGDLLDDQNHFLRIEIIDPEKNDGKNGYVAATVLSTGEDPVILPPDRLSTVMSATYRGVHPVVEERTEHTVMFEFTDGLIGSAEPVVNNISYKQESFFPDFLPLSRKLITNPACNAQLTLSMEAEGSVLEEETNVLRVDLPVGEDLVLETTVKLYSKLVGENGSEGWSISVQHDQPFFEILEATIEDTDAELLSDPDNRIIKNNIVKEKESSGFISAVVLSTAEARTLPPTGEFSIARAKYQLVAPHDEPGQILATPIRFEDGLKFQNEPVNNILTVEGESQNACQARPLQVEVNLVRGMIFQRGDPSNNGLVTLTDVVVIIQVLFSSPLSLPCPAASDADGNHAIELADAIYLLEYLFLDGVRIPDPYPGCAPDPRIDNPLSCDEERVSCP